MSHVQKTVDEVANMYISRCFRHEIRYSIEFGQTMNWWIVFEQTQSVRRSSASRLSCKSIADRKQEAFALLGVIGAGKTSTFRILTGEYGPTKGEAYISGFDVVNIRGLFRLGNYPQVDPTRGTDSLGILV